MKKILLPIAIAAMVLSTIFLACKKEDKDKGKVTSVTITFPVADTTINVGATLQFTAAVLREDATDKTLLWESSNQIVAEVNPTSGMVTARSAGVTIIKATSNLDGTKFDTIKVTVVRVPDATWGNIDFKTDSTWTVTNGTMKQVWSDAVVLENAKTAGYDGGSKEDGFKADALKNPGYGDLISWELVNTLKNKLCPYPWRMPDTTDFINLDKTLGGTGLGVGPNSTLIEAYVEQWGAAYGGYVGTSGLADQGKYSAYWSASENKQGGETEPYGMAWALGITNGVTRGTITVVPEGWVFNPADYAGSIAGCPAGSFAASPAGCMLEGDIEQRVTIPKSNLGKASGYQVRCIRDIE